MHDRLPPFLRKVLRDTELYLTLAACLTVLVMERFHVHDPIVVNAAILSVLFLLAISTLRDRSKVRDLRTAMARISDRIGGDPDVEWYIERSDATSDFFSDVEKHKYGVFIGISQRDLPEFLLGRLQGPALPWEGLEVYFASDDIGRAYEGERFLENICLRRQHLAAIVTDPKFVARLPRLKGIRLRQSRVIVDYTGSLFGSSPDEFSVVYVVLSSISLLANTRATLTLRLESTVTSDRTSRARLQHYQDSYRSLTKLSRNLGTFAMTVWDESADEWSRFASTSSVLPKSMIKLAELANIQGEDEILDLGAGSGETSERLIKNNPRSLMLLDNSPQMIRLAQSKFNGNPRVRFALCGLPTRDREDVDIENRTFSLIVIHDCVGSLASSFGSVDELAEWCHQKLRSNGRLVIAAHNGEIEMPSPKGFEAWDDPLRQALRTKFRQHLRAPAKKLTVQDLDKAFARKGFQASGKVVELLEMSWEERRQMWQIPAVIDSMIDIHSAKAETVAKFVDETVNRLRNHTGKSMPRTVTYWVFHRG